MGGYRIYRIFRVWQKTYYRYSYIKNIYFDKEKVQSKYPGVEFDESLRGKTISFNSTPVEVWTVNDCFRFGKYKYVNVNDCQDSEYIRWYLNSIENNGESNTKHYEFVKSVLLERGYKMFDGILMNNTEYNRHIETIEYINKLIDMVREHKPVEITVSYNFDENGYYKDDNGILYQYTSEMKENYYQGFSYYLPILNGKAKRVKNKTLRISGYTIGNNKYNFCFKFDKFEIVKNK